MANANIPIYFNPKTLLEAAGAGWVWSAVWSLILIGLTISFVFEVFKMQKKEKPDFVGVVWKAVFITLAYRYLPVLMDQHLRWISGIGKTAELDHAFMSSFNILTKSISGTVTTLPEGCAPDPDIGFFNFTFSFFSAHVVNMIARGILLICLGIVWVVKLVVFTWAWPTLLSVNMIGLGAALVMPSFPRQGFGSVGSFFKSIATIALWPVIYLVFMTIVGNGLTQVFTELAATLQCPTSYSITRITIQAIAGSMFMAYGIKSIPKMAEIVINHKGMGQVAAGAALAAGAMVAAAGSRIGGAVGSNMSQAGGKMASAARLKLNSLSGNLGGGSFTPPEPKGPDLSSGRQGYSKNQARDLVGQVAAKDPEKGKELRNKLKQAGNMASGRGYKADKSMQNNAVDSVAQNAIDFLQGDDK